MGVWKTGAHLGWNFNQKRHELIENMAIPDWAFTQWQSNTLRLQRRIGTCLGIGIHRGVHCTGNRDQLGSGRGCRKIERMLSFTTVAVDYLKHSYQLFLDLVLFSVLLLNVSTAWVLHFINYNHKRQKQSIWQ